MIEVMQPAVSLLVPIYNVERYLNECLSSALAQTLQNIEIICINDGSTDGSLDIMREFAAKDSRVKIIDKQNSGYGSSMNRGLRECTGEYVGILESDDFLEPRALELLYGAAIENEADVAKADFYLYWSTPEARVERFNWVDADAAGIVVPLEYEEVFFRKPSIWSAVYKRSFLEENGITFLETPGAAYQDAGFNFKVWACASKAVLVDEAVLYYRQDNEASSVNSPGKVFCVCDEYAEMVRFAAGVSGKQDALARLLVRMRFDTYRWNYERLSERLRPDFLDRMAQDFRAEEEQGLLDASLFDADKLWDRKLVLEYPELFRLRHAAENQQGKWDTIRQYCSEGGLPLLWQMLRVERFS